MADIRVHGSGTVYQWSPETEDGTTWTDENVQRPDWQPSGPIAVEHRYIEDITRGALESGLTVNLNGNDLYLNSDGDVVYNAA